MAEREVVFYSCTDDCEHLIHTDDDEAIEEWLDRRCEFGRSDDDNRAAFPETVTVYGWARMPPPEFGPEDVDALLEWVTERHYEELLDPDDAPDIPLALVAAANEFLATVSKELPIWSCEIVEERVVDVREWCAAHPDAFGAPGVPA
jgi:hypothetical protein